MFAPIACRGCVTLNSDTTRWLFSKPRVEQAFLFGPSLVLAMLCMEVVWWNCWFVCKVQIGHSNEMEINPELARIYVWCRCTLHVFHSAPIFVEVLLWISVWAPQSKSLWAPSLDIAFLSFSRNAGILSRLSGRIGLGPFGGDRFGGDCEYKLYPPPAELGPWFGFNCLLYCPL